MREANDRGYECVLVEAPWGPTTPKRCRMGAVRGSRGPEGLFRGGAAWSDFRTLPRFGTVLHDPKTIFFLEDPTSRRVEGGLRVWARTENLVNL